MAELKTRFQSCAVLATISSHLSLALAPDGDVGFAVFRALQSQHRLRMMAVLKSITDAPEEAAQLAQVDDDAIMAAVDDYIVKLNSALPEPLLIQVCGKKFSF